MRLCCWRLHTSFSSLFLHLLALLKICCVRIVTTSSTQFQFIWSKCLKLIYNRRLHEYIYIFHFCGRLSYSIQFPRYALDRDAAPIVLAMLLTHSDHRIFPLLADVIQEARGLRSRSWGSRCWGSRCSVVVQIVIGFKRSWFTCIWSFSFCSLYTSLFLLSLSFFLFLFILY